MKLHKVIKNLRNGIGTYAIRLYMEYPKWRISISDFGLIKHEQYIGNRWVGTNAYIEPDEWFLQFDKID